MLELADGARPLAAERVMIGVLIQELERLHPGLADKLVATAECEFTRASVVRLRGPRSRPETLAAFDEATRVLQRISALANSLLGPPRRRGWLGR